MKKKGFTLIELLVVVAIIALLISILLPSLSRARELTKRAVCSANLRGIGNGCHIYATDNGEWFPQSFYQEPSNYKVEAEERYLHDVEYTGAPGQRGKIGLDHTFRVTTPGSITAGISSTAVPISRSLFMTIIGGQCTAKLFICSSSGETEDIMRNVPVADGDETVAAQPGMNRFDFRGYPYLSYAYQMPFGMHGKPRTSMDPRMPLAADKGQYFTAAPELTTCQDGFKYAPENAKDYAGMESPEFVETTADGILSLSAESWRSYNSRNHTGEGQNVLSADGHVEYGKTPLVGLNSDNIYTRMKPDWTPEGSMLGIFPKNNEGPFVNTDSLLIP